MPTPCKHAVHSHTSPHLLTLTPGHGGHVRADASPCPMPSLLPNPSPPVTPASRVLARALALSPHPCPHLALAHT
eukprot:7281195-Prymnesium_polylepis.1